MKILRNVASASLLLIGFMAASVAQSASRVDLDRHVVSTVTSFTMLNGANARLAEKAAGVLIFPEVTKAGAGIAGEYGEGVLQVHGKTVGYYSLTSGSVGLTLGIAKHSQILMFMTQQSLDQFLASEGWSIGADAEVLVVKSGAHGEYDSMVETKPMLAFMFAEEGLIGDLSVVGTKISKMK
jgi:lipid-binding SYLF domain-containing protein